jgi:hypothetical protein
MAIWILFHHTHTTLQIPTQSVADENVFANRLHIPVVTIGPIGGGDHTAEEWVSLNSLKKNEFPRGRASGVSRGTSPWVR